MPALFGAIVANIGWRSGKVDPDITFAKLKAMVDGARIASERLWI